MERRRVLGAALLAGLLVVAVVALRGRVAAVDRAGGLPGPGVSALAVAATLAGNALLADAWRALVAATGVRLPWATAARVWTSSQLARYALGAAQVPGRVLAGRAHGVPALAGTLTTLVEIAWGLSLTAVVVLATAPAWLPAGGRLRWVALAASVPAAVVVAGLVAPGPLLAGLARLLRREAVAVPRRLVFGVTLRYAAVIALRSAVAVALAAAVGADPARDWPAVVGAWALGQVAGQLAVFAPGGIGVREGATAVVLGPLLGVEAALLLVALVRLTELAAELLAFCVTRLPPARPRRG